MVVSAPDVHHLFAPRESGLEEHGRRRWHLILCVEAKLLQPLIRVAVVVRQTVGDRAVVIRIIDIGSAVLLEPRKPIRVGPIYNPAGAYETHPELAGGALAVVQMAL